MIASGRLSRIPKIKPLAQFGSGRRAAPMTKPIAKRFRNAPVKAAVLSLKVSGNIDAAESAPYTRPQIVPRVKRDTGGTSREIVCWSKCARDSSHHHRPHTIQRRGLWANAASQSLAQLPSHYRLVLMY